MGIFNRAIPTIRTNEYDQPTVVPQEYYVDDIFDPLFNAKVREQLTLKYGNPYLGTVGGYLEGIDNALLGQDGKWGILGSGMGILSGFGRSMDKAGDFIIGGLTEGVKGISGQGFENPLHNIFVEDQDYSGQRLLAAMGNSMAGLAKAPRLTEEDFSGLWSIPSIGLELATDPGILGGGLSKAANVNLAGQVATQSVNKPLATAGKLLMDYDDIMAKVAMDITAPGLRPSVKALKNKIEQMMGHSDYRRLANIKLNRKETPEARAQAAEELDNDPNLKQFVEMQDELDIVEEQITQAEAAQAAQEPVMSEANMAQLVAAGASIPPAVQEELTRRKYATPTTDVADVQTYDDEIAKWLVTQSEITSEYAAAVRQAYTTPLKDLIASETSEATENEALIKAIQESNLVDVKTQAQRFKEFMDSDWAKANLKITNTNMYADVPEEFDLEQLLTGSDEVTALARKEFFDRLHAYARQRDSVKLNPEHLDTMLPRALAEKSYEEAPDTYNEFLLNLTYGLDPNPTSYEPFEEFHKRLSARGLSDAEISEKYAEAVSNTLSISNETARNRILSDLGFDPKSRKAKFIEKTPVKASPTWYAGRSDTTIKLQTQYAHKLLTNFVKNHDLSKLAKSAEFKRAFPSKAVRTEILNRLKHLTDTSKYEHGATKYINEVKQFTDYIIDNYPHYAKDKTFKAPDEFADILEFFKSVEEASPDGDVSKLFSFDELYLPLYDKSFPITETDKYAYKEVIDERRKLHKIISEFEKEGMSFSKIKRLLTTDFDKLKKQDIIPRSKLKRAGLTKSNVTEYGEVLAKYSEFQKLAADFHYSKLGLEEPKILSDLIDLSEDFQKNVVSGFDRRFGAPVRENNPLPFKDYNYEDDLGDDIEFDEITGESKDGKGRYRARSTGDLYGVPLHQYLNNLVRLNAEAFNTPEGFDILRKYFGDTYQLIAQGDLGTIDNNASKAIESFKKEMLPAIEELLSKNYSPYLFTKQGTTPKPGTPGYRIASALGLVPNVPASPYAKEYRAIMDKVIKDYAVFDNPKYTVPEWMFAHRPELTKSKIKEFSEIYRDRLLKLGVSETRADALLNKAIEGKKLTQSEMRVLSTAIQESPVVSEQLIRRDPAVAIKNTKAFVEDFTTEIDGFRQGAKALSSGTVPKDAILLKFERSTITGRRVPVVLYTYHGIPIPPHVASNDVRSSAFKEWRKHIRGKSADDIFKYLVTNKSNYFPPVDDTEFGSYFYSNLIENIRHINYFKYKSDITYDEVIKYFSDRPSEYPQWLTPWHIATSTSEIYPDLQVFQRNFANPEHPYRHSGWIDYGKLYGERKSYLWKEVTDSTFKEFRNVPNFRDAVSPQGVMRKMVEDSAQVPLKNVECEKLEKTAVEAVMNASSEEAAKLVTEMPTYTETVKEALAEALEVPPKLVTEPKTTLKPKFKKASSEPPKAPKPETPKASSPPPTPEPENIVPEGSPKDLYLAKLVNDAVVESSKARSKDRATLRTGFVKDLIDYADKVSGDGSVTPEGVSTYRAIQTLLSDPSVRPEEFLDTLATSGMFQMAFRHAENYDDQLLAIRHNVAEINTAAGAEILKVIHRKLPTNGNTVIGAVWNTNIENIPAIIARKYKDISNVKLFNVWRDEGGLTDHMKAFMGTREYAKIDEAFNRVRQQEAAYAKVLGFKYDDTKHVKNVMKYDEHVAGYFANELYEGINTADLDNLTDVLLGLDCFKHLRGAWGSRRFDRRLIGTLDNFAPAGMELFENDITRIVKGSLGEGSFNNSKFQLYVGLFDNDNFKISQFASNVDDLKRIFYATLDDGSMSGNMANLTLAAPRFDNTGRIIGFTQFDKTTDAGLQAALNNADTILVPTHVLAPLDAVLRKDAKMSNKWYAWVHRHLTLPFKFGVLMNPGFIIGNANDAYLKQATTMANKYGTSVSEELANVALAMKDVVVLNNKFDDAYRKFLVHIQEEGFTVAPTNHISETAAADPRIRNMLRNYIKGNLQKAKGKPLLDCRLSKEECGYIKLWLMLNSTAISSTFESGFQDMDVIAKAANSSKYQTPKDPIDRIFTGKGKYVATDWSTWGLFANNPLQKTVMNLSEGTENMFRSAAILNDLRHEGADFEWFKEYFDTLAELDDAIKLGDPRGDAARLKAKLKEDFNFKLTNAMNAMHNSNFDYEHMTNFTDTVGTFVPFPTFFLKNLAYWLDVMVNNPQYIDHAITVQEGFWGSRDTSKDKFAAEAKGRGAIPIGGQNMSSFFRGIYKPTPLQSMFGAFSLMNSPIEDIYYRLNPMVGGAITAASKLPPIEPIAANILPAENVKYRPYSTDMYERNITRDDPEFNPISYAIHRGNPMERSVQAAIRLPDKLRNDQAQLSDLLPSVFQPDFGNKTSK